MLAKLCMAKTQIKKQWKLAKSINRMARITIHSATGTLRQMYPVLPVIRLSSTHSVHSVSNTCDMLTSFMLTSVMRIRSTLFTYDRSKAHRRHSRSHQEM